MRFYEGTLYASVPFHSDDRTDRIVALPDDNGDGYPDRTVTVLESPEIADAHGFDFANGNLYLVNQDRTSDKNNIVRYEMDGLEPDTDTRTELTDEVPDEGGYYHWTRTLEVRDDHIYVTVGSNSNVAEGDDEPVGGWYARMTRCDIDGSDCTSYAEGLRNAVGFTFHDGKLFASDNGRDDLSDSAPPDEINIIEEGNDYGWPYCYGDNVPDPAHDDESRCEDTVGTAVNLRAHTVPLGIDFYTADSFPEEYQGDLYVAMHGSFDAEPPRGFKVVRIPYDGNSLGEPTDFVTGWYDSDGDGDPYEKGDDIIGRPADVTVGPDGHMYISDDSSGVIYRLRSENTPPTAEFSVSPSSPETGEEVSFDGTDSTDSDGSIESYSWDLDGDGEEETTGETTSFTYAEAGSFTASLTVTDDDGVTNTTTRTIDVEEPNVSPTAEFTVSPSNPDVGEEVSFDGSDSADSDGSIVSYSWDFDGDGTEDASGETATFTYSTNGSYTVSLTVVDDDGANDTISETITVQDQEADEPSLEDYTNENNVVDTSGLLDAIDDWRSAQIDTALLLDVIDAWRTGTPIS
ncbi:PKD domain-containing protein [Halovenus amylolytica]|uniref:PKD domain-containing protein n=1 Tax=Halovenus amylolytica TaxID=2500550 RepID=UPI003D6B2408